MALTSLVTPKEVKVSNTSKAVVSIRDNNIIITLPYDESKVKRTKDGQGNEYYLNFSTDKVTHTLGGQPMAIRTISGNMFFVPTA